MATHTGSEGTIKIGSTVIGELRSYTLEQTGDTIEDTSMGDSVRSYKAGLKSSSGSASVFFDEADAGQLLCTVGSSITLNVFPEGASAGVSEKYYTGTATVTGKTITGSFDGMVESTITLQGTGALTEATLA